MARKPPRGRTEKRVQERRLAKLTRDQEKLARIEPGGGPDRPIGVTSASVIEPEVRAKPCPLCAAPLQVEEHAAVDELRVVHALCARCGVRRSIYFQIHHPS
jgi:hypothetical protein